MLFIFARFHRLLVIYLCTCAQCPSLIIYVIYIYVIIFGLFPHDQKFTPANISCLQNIHVKLGKHTIYIHHCIAGFHLFSCVYVFF